MSPEQFKGAIGKFFESGGVQIKIHETVAHGPLVMNVRTDRITMKAGLQDVVFTGFVSNEMLPRYYRSAHVFCAPNTGGESQGIILLEALACGVPVVALLATAALVPSDGYASLIGAIIAGALIGLAATMVLCAYGIRSGTNTVGDFVMINAMMKSASAT